MEQPFDDGIMEMLQMTFDAGSMIPSPYTPDQLRMAIVGLNLKALANTILAADEHPERIQVNFKQLALGILGTADWLTDSLPSLDEDIQRNTVPKQA